MTARKFIISKVNSSKIYNLESQNFEKEPRRWRIQDRWLMNDFIFDKKKWENDIDEEITIMSANNR